MSSFIVILMWVFFAGLASYLQKNKKKDTIFSPDLEGKLEELSQQLEGHQVSDEEVYLDTLDNEDLPEITINSTEERAKKMSQRSLNLQKDSFRSRNLQRSSQKQKRTRSAYHSTDSNLPDEKESINTSYRLDSTDDLKRAFVWSEIFNRRY